MKKENNGKTCSICENKLMSAVVAVLLIGNLYFALGTSKKVEVVGGARIGTVNMIKVQTESEAIKSLNAQRDSYIKKLEKLVEGKKKEFAKKEKSLKAQQATLSQEAFQKKVMEFQKSMMDADSKTKAKLQAVKESYTKALTEIQKDYLDGIMSKIAQEDGFDLLTSGTDTITINTDLDITDKVVDALNDEVGEVKMDKPTGF